VDDSANTSTSFRYLKTLAVTVNISGMNMAEFRTMAKTQRIMRRMWHWKTAAHLLLTAMFIPPDKGNDGTSGTIWSTTSTDMYGGKLI